MENFTKKGIINISGKDTEEQIQKAKGCETIRVRIQGSVESKIRSGSKKVIKVVVLNVLHVVHEKTKDLLEDLDTRGEFEKKFTQEQIEQFAYLFPAKRKMTIQSVQDHYSMFDLSWRQAKKIIDREKEMFPNRNREVF